MGRQPRSDNAGSASLAAGLVISHLGKSLSVEANDGSMVVCQPGGRDQIAVGDRVVWESRGDGNGRIIERCERRSLLTRPGRKGRVRAVAANIDFLLILLAHEPSCDWLLVDQYLIACETGGIEPILVVNKIDTVDDNALHPLNQELTVYRSLGYRQMMLSAKTGAGLEKLRSCLQGHSSLLVGQSGVGKSSLTNALLPGRALKVAELSTGSGLGKHTTTSATVYHLPTGGDLIDSPGVSVFGLAGITERDLADTYPGFRPLARDCRFSDCRHVDDLGCAVKLAVDREQISRGGYQRYLKLRSKLPTIS